MRGTLLLVLALVIALLLLLALPAHAQSVAVWGMESWTCGTSEFRTRLGSGADVHLLSISGTVTAAATSSDSVLRQSLLAIYPGLPNGVNAAVIYTTPGNNHSLDEHMANVNMKQVGLGATAPVQVQQTFDPPLLLRGGDLRAVIVTANYGGTSPTCLNTEVQTTVVWQ